MFKAKIKKNILITLGISVLGLQMGFGNFLSLDLGLAKIAERVKSPSASITTMDKSTSVGDVFLSLYDNNEMLSENSSTINAINDITNDILTQNQPNCRINTDDIVTILSSNIGFIQDMYNNNSIPSSTTLQVKGSLEESCDKLFYCYSGPDAEKANTRKRIENCKTIVYDQYITKKELGKEYLSQSNNNRNDNIYLDNNENNAPFDLFQDIQRVREILFQDNNPPEAPQMIYYSMPSRVYADTTAANDIPGSILGFGGPAIGSIPSNLGAQAGSNLDTRPNTTTLSNNTNNDFSNFVANSSPDNIASTNQATTTTSIAGTVSSIQAPLCPAPNTLALSLPETLPTDLGSLEQLTQVQGQLFDSLSGLLFQAPSANDRTSLENLSNRIVGGSNSVDNRIQTQDPSPESLQCTASCEDKTSAIEKQVCEGNCCINTCNTINNLNNRAICISQCLCGEISTKNDELRIKFCTVPAQTSRVVANKTIFNVEQAIDAINGVFRYLKNNGLMTKRTKTKELLDSSFSDIKLSQILSFDIFVAFKPLYDKISFSRLKENKNKEIAATQQAIYSNAVRLGDHLDTSRYVVLANHPKIQAQKNIYTSFGQFNDQVKNLSKIYCQQQGKEWIDTNGEIGECVESNYLASKNTNTKEQETLLKLAANQETSAVINDNIYKFIDQNYIFWEQIGKSINDMLSTSNTLKLKAEDAK